MWKETGRFQVEGNRGTRQIIVEMVKDFDRKPLTGKARAVPRAAFYFLLDGTDVAAVPDGTFIVHATGEILRRI